MKNLLFSFVLAVAFGIFLLAIPSEAEKWPDSCGNNRTHNFEFGRMSYGDRVLNSTHIAKSKSFLRVLSFDYNIQTRGRITYIQVFDQTRDGNGGCVYLNGGGIGQYYVNLHVKSARNYGVNFIVNVYGH